MLSRTSGRLKEMTAHRHGEDRTFHYLPFCFAGSRIVLWTCLYRNNGLHVSTDLENLATEFGAVKPNYFLNVPVLLERIKNGALESFDKLVLFSPQPIEGIGSWFVLEAEFIKNMPPGIDAAYPMSDTLRMRTSDLDIGQVIPVSAFPFARIETGKSYCAGFHCLPFIHN